MYPHTMTAILSSSAATVRKNAIFITPEKEAKTA